MNCHSQLFANSPYLEIVRESWRSGKPIKWTRVHDLPDFSYFNHSIHVNKGVGCSSCHGRVDLMPLMWNTASLQMEWCLSCHRNPEAVLRDQKDITKMDWVAPADQEEKGGPEGAAVGSVARSVVLGKPPSCHASPTLC